MKISSVSSVGGAYKTAESRPQRGKAAAPEHVAKTNATSAAKTNVATTNATQPNPTSATQSHVEKPNAAKSAPATASRRINIVA